MNPYDPPPEPKQTSRSIFPTLIHYVQSSLACAAMAVFLVWLGLLGWEITHHEILIEDYVSGFLSWALILVFLRRFVIFTFARPQPSDSAQPPDERNKGGAGR